MSAQTHWKRGSSIMTPPSELRAQALRARRRRRRYTLVFVVGMMALVAYLVGALVGWHWTILAALWFIYTPAMVYLLTAPLTRKGWS